MAEREMDPTPGPATESALPQAHMVVPASGEEPGETEHEARQGGTLHTVAYSEEETRPQQMHSAAHYQETTADPGGKPEFVAYTDLTKTRGEVRG